MFKKKTECVGILALFITAMLATGATAGDIYAQINNLPGDQKFAVLKPDGWQVQQTATPKVISADPKFLLEAELSNKDQTVLGEVKYLAKSDKNMDANEFFKEYDRQILGLTDPKGYQVDGDVTMGLFRFKFLDPKHHAIAVEQVCSGNTAAISVLFYENENNAVQTATVREIMNHPFCYIMKSDGSQYFGYGP